MFTSVAVVMWVCLIDDEVVSFEQFPRCEMVCSLLTHPSLIPLTLTHTHTHSLTGYTDDVLEYIRVSVPKTMLADLKDSVKNGRSLNIQDRYGATAVSTSHPAP